MGRVLGLVENLASQVRALYAGRTGGPEAMSGRAFDAVKIFSATTSADRDRLGDRVTTWIAQNPTSQIVDRRVLQSSDERFHCVTIVLFVTDGSA